MINKEEKSAYNRAYAIANRERISVNRAARRAGIGNAQRCKVRGCQGVHDALGYCARHYMAFRRNGDATIALQEQYHGRTLAERFALRVKKGLECWTWTGATNKKGYGVMRVGSTRNIMAHRVAYELECGPVPDGLFVLHRCDNPPCVRISHLFLGTKADNIADMDAKGRRVNAQLKGAQHPSAILTETDVMAIRDSRDQGVDLANRYGVTQTTICDIKKRRSWRNVV